MKHIKASVPISALLPMDLLPFRRLLTQHSAIIINKSAKQLFTQDLTNHYITNIYIFLLYFLRLFHFCLFVFYLCSFVDEACYPSADFFVLSSPRLLPSRRAPPSLLRSSLPVTGASHQNWLFSRGSNPVESLGIHYRLTEHGYFHDRDR